jgi:ceramide glucosyltransferase
MAVAAGLFQLVSGLCATGAALGCFYLLAASVAVLRFCRSGAPASAQPEPVTVLKPLHGAEPGLRRRLDAICRQDYGAKVQVLCGVRDRADAAVGIVESLAAHEPRLDLVVDARQRSSNPKISNLANMLPRARHDVLVMVDSDVEVAADYLRNVTAELDRPGVGVVSCLSYGASDGGIWSDLAALGINGHFLPSVLVALALRLAEPCFGPAIALRRSMLFRIGGIEAFGGVLAEDYEIGRAVRAAGYAVAIPAFATGHACYEPSLGALLAHELRAARTVKSIDRIGYCGTILTHPLPLALLAALSGAGFLLAGIALACRLVLCLCVEHRFDLPRQPYWLIPLRDLLSFVTYLRGLFGNAVNWRGATYRITCDGRLPVDRERA